MEPPSELSLTRGGLVHRLAGALHRGEKTRPIVLAVIVALVGWLPAAILALIDGLLGNGQAFLFFTDLTTIARSLVAVPLLVLAESVVDLHVSDADRRIARLAEPGAMDTLTAMKRTLAHGINNVAIEVAVLVVALAPAVLRLVGVTRAGGETWYLAGGNPHPTSLAGWWYALVAVPILPALLLRWCWRYGWWTWFLLRTSRLPLRLISTHPDGAAGLGFVARVQGSFYPVVAAVSVMIGAGWAESIRDGKAVLETFALPFLLLLAGIATLFVLPTVAFVWRLATLRVVGHSPFDALVSRYHRDFKERWVNTGQPENPLGTPDIQSLNDLNGAYETAHKMRIQLMSLKGALPLLEAALLPMLLPVAVSMPLHELVGELLGHLV